MKFVTINRDNQIVGDVSIRFQLFLSNHSLPPTIVAEDMSPSLSSFGLILSFTIITQHCSYNPQRVVPIVHSHFALIRFKSFRNLFQLYPTSITALVKSNDSPILVCFETEPDQPIKLRKLLLTHSELNALMSSIVNEVQQCQQALNDENDKRDMYKVRRLSAVALRLREILANLL